MSELQGCNRDRNSPSNVSLETLFIVFGTSLIVSVRVPVIRFSDHVPSGIQTVEIVSYFRNIGLQTSLTLVTNNTHGDGYRQKILGAVSSSIITQFPPFVEMMKWRE